jgi:hypothetical protein
MRYSHTKTMAHFQCQLAFRQHGMDVGMLRLYGSRRVGLETGAIVSPFPMRAFSWIHPALQARESRIDGCGYFAKKEIQAGEIVIVQSGRILATETLETPPWNAFAYTGFQIGSRFYISPFLPEPSQADGIFLVNHSCVPTCGFLDNLMLVSLVAIPRGGEITYDYAMSDMRLPHESWHRMKCCCGAPSCRGLVTGDDWRDPSLRARFEGRFQPYLKQAFRRNGDGISSDSCKEDSPLIPVGWSLLHAGVEIRDAGRQGRGVFAKRNISSGEILCVLGGQVADTALQNALSSRHVNYSMDFSEEFSFCPLEESQVPLMPQFYFNHSCRPNCGFRDSQTIVAIRPISQGEECRYDYAFCMWNDPRSAAHFEMQCTCGEPECRGVVREDDSMLESIQAAYGRWFMPFLRRKWEGEAPSEPIIVGSHGGSPSQDLSP